MYVYKYLQIIFYIIIVISSYLIQNKDLELKSIANIIEFKNLM